MKIINLGQRDDAWHEWRANGLSASDAAVILGLSPYKTPWKLWSEKTGYAVADDLSRNPNVRRGVKLEDEARGAAEAYFGSDFDPLLPICAESDVEPILRASFDGIRGNGEPVELKVPAESTFEDVKKERESSKAYRVYYPQVQHQMYVCDAQKGWLMFYNPDEADESQRLIVFEIKRDQAMIDELVTKCLELWDFIKNRKEPPKDPERDVYIPEGADADSWIYAAEEHNRLDDQVKALEAEVKKLKQAQKPHIETMKEMMIDKGFYSCDFAGVKLTRFSQQGNIDNAKLISELLPNLDDATKDKYRKPDSERWRVNRTKSLAPKNVKAEEVSKSLEHAELKVSSEYF